MNFDSKEERRRNIQNNGEKIYDERTQIDVKYPHIILSYNINQNRINKPIEKEEKDLPIRLDDFT